MFEKFTNNLKKLIASTDRDRVMLYAAQASYYVIVSAIPFVCLVISVISFFIPDDIYTIVQAYDFPKEIENLIIHMIDQLFATQKVSLLSISAIFALWTASRGTDSLIVGLERVYHEKRPKDFFRHQIKSLISTLLLIVLLLGNIALATGRTILTQIMDFFKLADVIMYGSTILLLIGMCVAFTILYAFVGKIRKVSWKERLFQHLPGAIFTTAGWTLFTYFLSLYIKHFPSASAIYGSLTAVCLGMLWIYVVIVILLLGAEINKLIMRNRGVIVKSEEQ
ncbi:MAG: YihY/virulence factor BrkB family protein [Lachnospiraceae bacterium]|nr:YihY/virulence factor BrkB family protein [Lachnospiraceae bacterium]